MGEPGGEDDPGAGAAGEHDLLKLWVEPALARAFRRCSWIIVHETGRSQPEIMEEMVRDFLVKHGC
ncbi:MAG: hypothetical protein ACOY3Z_10780 [Thermodesulfobacteriota bacterium]